MRGFLVFILGYIAGVASVCLVIYLMFVVFSFSVNSMSTNSTTYVEETEENTTKEASITNTEDNNVAYVLDDRIKLFEEPTDCVSTMTFRITHVIDEYYAEAEEVKRSTYPDGYMSFYGNLTVVIQSDNQDVFYDDQIIKVPAGKCMRQIGVYSYSIDTYPVVRLSK